jgi:hypothetical protein
MKLVKCFALSAALLGIFSMHVFAATPVSTRATKAETMDAADMPPSNPAATNPCPATGEGLLVSGGGTINGDTCVGTDDFSDDYPATCSYGPGPAPDAIHSFQVDASGVWNFNTSMVCWDTSLGVREDTGGGCPGDPIACDGDGLNDCYFESSLDVFLVAGNDYYLVVDGYGFSTCGAYGVNYSLIIPACADDAACSDGDPCNGAETCNTANGQCDPGTPPCSPAQTCDPSDGSCTDPDGCLIYQNDPATLGAWSTLSQPSGALIADDWVFDNGNLGRNLVEYNVVTVGLGVPSYLIVTSLWGHGSNCVGGSNVAECGSQMGECDVDADCGGGFCVGGAASVDCTFQTLGVPCVSNNDCPGNCSATTATLCLIDADCPLGETCINQGVCPGPGTCQLLGFTVDNTFPAHGPPAGPGEIPGTLCVAAGIPTGYFVNLNCVPGPGAVLPTEGAYIVLGTQFGAGGQVGPALASQVAEIGSSHLRVYADNLTGGLDWTRYFFGSLGLGGTFVGDVCTEALGACCTPGLGGACTISTEVDCTTGGGTYIGDNNAVTEFDCGADADGDGVTDPCDACPDNADFAADTGPCNCSSSDVDGDGTLDCVDACPDNPDFAADQGPCSCSSADADGDGTLDCVDACPFNPDFAANQGPCACSSADADGDGTLDCVDGCPDDPNKIEAGICGCGVDDNADSDGDTVPDCIDQCPGVNDATFAPECAGAIPTVSEWGLVVLALLLLAAGKVYFGRRRALA